MGGAAGSAEPMAGSGGAGTAAGAGGLGGQTADEDAGAVDTPDAGPRVKPPPPPVARRCTLPTGCVGLATDAFAFAACCSRSVECGFQLEEPADFRELFFIASGSFDPLDPGSRCVPLEKIFNEGTGLEEQRIVVDEGEDIFLTPECDSRNLLAFPLHGCCTSAGMCGYSTDQTRLILENYVPDAPFSKAACFTGAELNAQFRMTEVAGLGHLPEMRKSCDYAAISARHPE